MWPISMPRASSSGSPLGTGIAVADVGHVEHAVGREVAPGDEADDVAAVLVGAGDPASCR